MVVDGEVVNDLTIEQLQRQALMHARAGADMVAPSDMVSTLGAECRVCICV